MSYAYIEDLSEAKYVKAKVKPVAWCECCEKDIYEGDKAVKDNRFTSVQAYICTECFLAMDKKDLAEALGATYEEVF